MIVLLCLVGLLFFRAYSAQSRKSDKVIKKYMVIYKLDTVGITQKK